MKTMISTNSAHSKTSNKRPFLPFFKWCGDKLRNIFKPEEVEVTFTGEGNNVTYTYTKVSQKQVA